MPRLILLGGFLGSGKTTTLLRLADLLVMQGRRVGILTNDQGQELVDTELFRASGHQTRDVRGGCFCCRLDDFVAQADSLMSADAPEFLLAEPVGSCTDLVATVLRPLRDMGVHAFEIAPYTVLVDPFRAYDALAPGGKATLSEKVTYIYRLQQMEADVIAINKIDALPAAQAAEVRALVARQFPARPILDFSARTGEGFDALLASVIGPGGASYSHSPDVDYELYAQGEAELAWYDSSCAILADLPLDIDDSLMKLGTALQQRLSAAGLEIAHIKLLLRAGDAIGSISIARGSAAAETTRKAAMSARRSELLVNARVAARPDQLSAIAEEALRSWASDIGASVSPQSRSSFAPPRPVPTRRIS